MTMSKSLMRFPFLFLLLLCCLSPSSFAVINNLVPCGPRQIQAFTQFKNEFDTRGCNHSDSLNGVWCDTSTGAVTKLQLRSCLKGTLKSNSSLFKFHQLRYLNLSRNNFISSSLPFEFGNLNKLEALYLYSNGFIGQVPSSFNNLSLLTYLDLSLNKLTSSFPFIPNLTNLSFLDFSYNHFYGTLNPNSSLFELCKLRYLDLSFNNFSSSLPSDLANLNKLEILALTSNSFFGHFPSTISNLTMLIKLFIDINQFSGSFPLIQNLTNLSGLIFSTNRFSGPIPSSLFTMPLLSYIDLRDNRFNGSIEVSNSSLSHITERLFIGRNHFEVKIIEPISKLIRLKQLDLSFLNTSDHIDLNLFSSLKSLSYLDISGNNISTASLSSDSHIPLTLQMLIMKKCGVKEFPNILKTLHNLEIVDLSNNRIYGKVPEWFWSLPRLSTVSKANNLFNVFEGSTIGNSSVQILDLSYNRFEGALPNLPPSINVLVAVENSFTGEIPLSICNISSFVVLDLSYNNITGPIPPCLNNFMFVNLRKNNLHGSIPDDFFVSCSLRTLNVGYNQLNGKLPVSLVNCSSLKFLSVDYNRIEDAFPFWLKALPNLQVLNLRSNKFFGPISPPHQGSLGFPELRIFEISDNKFNGSLPPNYFVNWKASSPTMNENGGLYMQDEKSIYGVFYYEYMDSIDLHYKGLSMEQERVLTSYATIDFSGNRLEGEIPESIGFLKALIALNLSNNAFTGQIPPSLANLRKLESLDLSSNQLSGTIPSGFKTLSFLAYINVSHNILKGDIPQGTQIIGQPKSSFEGNVGLCGLPLEENCYGTNASPTQQEEEEEDNVVLSWKAVVIGYVPGMLLGLAIAQVISLCKPHWLVKITGPSKRRNR